MTRRTKVLIGITTAVVIIMAIAIYFLWKMRGTVSALPSQAVEAPGSTTTLPGSTVNPVPVTHPAATPFATAEATARSFVERWGSFSSESNFQNVADLYPVMTPTMRTWAASNVTGERKVQAAMVGFYGITTRAMKTEVIEKTADGVRIRVTAQRIETKGANPSESSYKTMEVALKQVGQAWLVDGAWWK